MPVTLLTHDIVAIHKGDRDMTRCCSLTIIAAILTCALGATTTEAATASETTDSKGKVCRMEQQCHWENFKKICTWVKVCR
jgi:hypothetical protein